MKPRIHILQFVLKALPAMAAAVPLSLGAAPPAQNAKSEIQPAVSSFVMPANPAQGRDPFFPESTMRLYASNSQSQSHAPVLTDLVLKSILGAPPRLLAIINNHTFATGDAGDVIVPSGQRIHIYCTDINLQAGTVTVEAGGASETLHLAGGI